jgi:hypothetical protein
MNADSLTELLDAAFGSWALLAQVTPCDGDDLGASAFGACVRCGDGRRLRLTREPARDGAAACWLLEDLDARAGSARTCRSLVAALRYLRETVDPTFLPSRARVLPGAP